jgi:uncharacterized protein (TIGR02757 family)
VIKQQTKLQTLLEGLYSRYNHRSFIEPDPLQFVYRYRNPADMEIVAFLAAELAYGRVQQIQKSLTNLLARMNGSPFEFVSNFDEHKRRKLKDFKHRFTDGDSLSDLLMLLRKVLRRYESIQDCFVQGYNSGDKNIIPALSKFCNLLLHMHAESHNGDVSRGLGYLLPKLSAGSACKRLNLFLRWMVRNDDVDTGLWESIDKAKLLVPVDVHMGRLCRILGLHNDKTISLSTSVIITESFAKLEPADPVKYDFALSRIGILGNCSGSYRPECEVCELFEFCNHD